MMNLTNPLIVIVLIASAIAGVGVAASSPDPASGNSPYQGTGTSDGSVVVVFPAANGMKAIPGGPQTVRRPVAVLRLN